MQTTTTNTLKGSELILTTFTDGSAQVEALKNENERLMRINREVLDSHRKLVMTIDSLGKEIEKEKTAKNIAIELVTDTISNHADPISRLHLLKNILTKASSLAVS